MKLVCLGGAGEIGANSYYLGLARGRVGLILDAGLHPKKEGPAALPLLDRIPDEVHHIVVTHAHLDHVGALPVLMARFPRARIHFTQVAFRFAERMLGNAVNVMRRRNERDREAVPLYGFDEVEALADRVETHPFDQPFPVGGGATVTFVPAGHIPGAAGVLVDDGGRRFFYTGDTCGGEQLLLPGARYPKGPIDALLVESTYGGNVAADAVKRAEVARDFTQRCAEVVSRGGRVLVPVFALGRAQELLFALWAEGQRGRLPKVPVYLTGLAVAFTRLYDATRRDAPRRDPDMRLGATGFQVLDEEALAEGAPLRPSITLASSGMMLPDTLSNRLARQFLDEPDDAVFIVGYQDPDSPGYRVQRSAEGEAIDLADGRGPVVRRAALERFYFSAHSKRRELLSAMERMRPRHTIFCHGDAGSGRSLADTIEGKGGRVTLPEPGEPYVL